MDTKSVFYFTSSCWLIGTFAIGVFAPRTKKQNLEDLYLDGQFEKILVTY
jgi:hypothetical protein